MEDEFYSVLKLVSGEELMAKVCPCYEDDRIVLILDNPVVIKDIIDNVFVQIYFRWMIDKILFLAGYFKSF